MKTLQKILPAFAICSVLIAIGIISGASLKQAYSSQNESIIEPVQEVEKPTAPVSDKPTAFAVSASPIKAFRAPKGDQIKANGNQYFIVDEMPEKVEAVLIFTEGDHKSWVVVRKVSGGRSVKLAPFAKNQFLFEHTGTGQYEVTSLDEKSEPVFDYFEVEGATPEDPKDPVNPQPPATDFSKLIETAKANANADLETRKKLGQAWDAALKSSASLPELKKKIGLARADILSMLRDQDGSWNKWLLAIDEWFKANPTADYSQAMKELARWMTN